MTDPQHHGALRVIPGTHASEHGASLGTPIRRLVSEPLLRDTFHALFAHSLTDCTSGWPHRVATDSHHAFLRDGDVVLELGTSPSSSSFALSLSASTAVRLIEGLLGARTGSELSSVSGQPSEAECGVLAYAAARLLASSAADESWLLRDVRSAGRHAGSALSIAWPLALTTGLGKLAATLWLPDACLAAWHPTVPLRLLVREQVEARALAELRTGDVWISESATLTRTSEGLVGPLSLAAEGTDTRFSGRLLRGRVRSLGQEQVTRSVVSSTHEDVEMVLGEQLESVSTLAALASGESLRISPQLGTHATLQRSGETIARGELVTWRGHLGLHVLHV